MAIEGGSVRWIIEADASAFDSALDEASQKADQFQRSISKTDSTIRGGVFNKLNSSTRELSASFVALGNSLKSVGWSAFSAGATALTGAMTSLVRKGIQATDFLETARTQMSGLTGSVQEGNKAMSIAANFWQNNPFQRFDVTQATQQLVQFGRTTNQLSSDLELLGKVSLSTRTPIDELARYYARISASGRAMTQDLEMMSDRGIPIYRELGKVLNTTQQGVRDLASKGKIDFKTFKEAMDGAVDANAMKQFEDTLARQMDRIKGSVQILAGDLAGYKIINNELVISANGLEKAWTRLIKTMATELRSEKFRDAMARIGESLAKVVDKITEMVPLITDKLGKVINFIGEHSSTLIPILGGVLTIFGRLGATLPGIGGVIGSIGGQFNGLTRNVLNLVKAKPALMSFIGLFGAGFIAAMKNSEDFRNTVYELLQSLGQLAKNLIEATRPLIQVFIKIISSSAVVSILQTLVGVLNALAKALASIPTEVLTSIITALLVFKTLRTSPIMGFVTAISLLVVAFKELAKNGNPLQGIGEFFSSAWKKITTGIGNFANSVKSAMKKVAEFIISPIKNGIDFLASIPKNLAVAGHNMIVGLVNGLANGAKSVFNAVKNIGIGIANTLRSALGIHSPSKVTYEVGKFVALGLADGITDNTSVVQKAMDDLASAVLSTSEKIIENKQDFGVIDLNGVYKEWKKVSQLFTIGSEQYKLAMEKMEAARKQVNLKIIQLQQAYNEQLDDTIDKIRTMYKTFEKVNLQGGMDSSHILSNMDQQVAQMEQWLASQEIIAGLNLDPEFIKELQSMGVDAVNELQAVANMTSSELGKLNDLWLKKQEIANKGGVLQMKKLKDDTLKQIDQLKDGIDGATVDVVDVGGRLVSNIGEGVTGSLPTLEEAFSHLGDYIKDANKSLGKTAAESAPNAAVDPVLDVPETGKGIEDDTKELGVALNDMKGSLIGIIGGVVAAIAAWKFGPKILKALGISGERGLAARIGGMFGGLFGKGSVAKEAGGAVTESAKIAQSTTQIGENITKVSSGVSKAQSVMNTVIKGAVAVAAIAGAIIALSFALKKAYEFMSGIDFGQFQLDIVMMGEAIAAIGGLAWIGGHGWKNIGKGLVLILGIAGDLAAVAFALKKVNDFIPDDLELLGHKLDVLEVVIGALGALAFIGGIAWKSIGKGLLLILGIAGDLISVAYALKKVNDYVPDDIGILQPKFAAMAEAIGGMGLLAGVMGIAFPVIAAGLVAILGIAGDLIAVAKALNEVDKNISEKAMRLLPDKIAVMRYAIWQIGELSFIGGIGFPAIGAGCLALAGIAGSMIKCAIALKSIYQNVPNNLKKLTKKIDILVYCIKYITSTELTNLFSGIKNMIRIAPIQAICDSYAKIAIQLGVISKISLNRKQVLGNIDTIKEVISKVMEGGISIGDILAKWGLDIQKDNIEKSSKVVEAYGSIAENIQKIASIGETNKDGTPKLNAETIKAAISTLADIVAYVITHGKEFDGLFTSWGLDMQKDNIEKSSKVVETYANMVDNLSKLNNLKLGEGDDKLSKARVEKAIDTLAGIVEYVTTKGASFGNLFSVWGSGFQADVVANTGKIVETYTKMTGELKKIENTVWAEDAVDIQGANMGNKRQLIVEKNLNTLGNIVELITTKLGRNGGIAKNIKDFIVGNGIPTEAYQNDLNKYVVFLGTLQTNLKKLENGGVNAQTVSANLKGIADSINSIKDIVITVINNSLTTFTELGSKIVDSINSGIRSRFPDAVMAATDLQGAFWGALEAKFPDELAQGSALAEQVIKGIGSQKDKMGRSGAELQGKFWRAIEDKFPDEVRQGSALAQQVLTGIASKNGDFATSGTNATMGFVNGMLTFSCLTELNRAGRRVAETAIKAIKKRGEEGSPWKTTKRSGNWAVEGLIEGMKESENALMSEAESLTAQVIDILSMDDVSISPTITARGENLAPSILPDSANGFGRRNVVIEQTNNNFTKYSLEQVNRDLAWEISKI